jgi:SAM-dependent methyltransferase
MGYAVAVVDISASMLEKAKQKDKEQEIRFINGRMKKLGSGILKGQEFDAAVCLGVASSNLPTNNDAQAFLRGVRKILRRNDLFVFNARNAKKISEDCLNKLLLNHVIAEDSLQLLFLTYNTRNPENRNIIVWRPIYLMNENGKVDFQIKEHRLRWFRISTLKRLLTQNKFEVLGLYSAPTKEKFDENEDATMWFVTTTK